ncbi:Os04g0127100 [Oryza sativa Japonica Group]|uniref:Os04g0127100 protein n=1 Tax=Oryza sativa subsp. japonica TaxID=39947 RepID=B7F194_ORYSJ|nr:hypothetical protein EE612_022027 [Oryza sativa]BAG98391.1 unnamed protein product [Oryza sativa Japonica Group]BAS87678.1 Os04g0127100 [Oryza sativa Japonica Group]
MADAACNEGSHCRLVIVVLLLILLLPLQTFCQQSTTKKLYVVYLGDKQHEDPEQTTASHHDMLTAILGSKEEAHDSMIYSYKHGFSGFSAMLTESQAQEIAGNFCRNMTNSFHLERRKKYQENQEQSRC